jgi:hypothetical protein
MTNAVEALRDTAAERLTLGDDLIDDPDCLAEFEFTFSVFRFRYTWGTVFEFSFSHLSIACERKACFALMPAAHVYLETIETNTLGVGGEVTHRFVTADV